MKTVRLQLRTVGDFNLKKKPTQTSEMLLSAAVTEFGAPT